MANVNMSLAKALITEKTGFRASKDAVLKMKELIENYGFELAEKAKENAEKDKRKTIQAKDFENIE
jgi:histone H3/H4